MRKQGMKSRYPGVYSLSNNQFRIRAVVTDRRTGKRKAVEKVVEASSAQEASRMRASLLDAKLATTRAPERVRVGEYARSWMKSKLVSLDPTTANTYASALEDQILPALGDLWYDELTRADIQRWVDGTFERGWRTATGKKRSYARDTVHGFYRVLRTMTEDAVDELDLPKNPCKRIRFPQKKLSDDSNTLEPEELVRFLAVMRQRYPQHYAMVALLAFTGLRFTHASGLKWEDWNEAKAILRVQRKHNRKYVSPVTSKKRAPREIPVEPELTEILRWHHKRMKDSNAPGFSAGWMFPSSVGTLRTPNTLDYAWTKCMAAVGIKRRFTVHGLRYTFTDLIRLANVDAVVRRALTGHVTQEMQEHYSSVRTNEKRAAIAGAMRVLAESSKRPEPDLSPESVN